MRRRWAALLPGVSVPEPNSSNYVIPGLRHTFMSAATAPRRAQNVREEESAFRKAIPVLQVCTNRLVLISVTHCTHHVQQILLIYAVTQFGEIIHPCIASPVLTKCQRETSLAQILPLRSLPLCPRYPGAARILCNLIHQSHPQRRTLLGRWGSQSRYIFTCQQTLQGKYLPVTRKNLVCLTLSGMTSPLGIGAKHER